MPLSSSLSLAAQMIEQRFQTQMKTRLDVEKENEEQTIRIGHCKEGTEQTYSLFLAAATLTLVASARKPAAHASHLGEHWDGKSAEKGDRKRKTNGVECTATTDPLPPKRGLRQP